MFRSTSLSIHMISVSQFHHNLSIGPLSVVAGAIPRVGTCNVRDIEAGRERKSKIRSSESRLGNGGTTGGWEVSRQRVMTSVDGVGVYSVPIHPIPIDGRPCALLPQYLRYGCHLSSAVLCRGALNLSIPARIQWRFDLSISRRGNSTEFGLPFAVNTGNSSIGRHARGGIYPQPSDKYPLV